MIRSSKRFVWLDDDPDRERSSLDMQANLEVKVDFINLKDKILEDEILTLENKPEPCLIILDQNLIETTSNTFHKGSTVAAIIREKLPECPIVCVTGENIGDFSNQQKQLFEDVFPFSSISSYYSIINSIADSFISIKNKRPTSTNDLFDLIIVPEEERNKMLAVLPSRIKENFGDNSLIVEISRWVREILMKKPGFLYDKLWSSTLIGINEGGFDKIEPLLKEAEYVGVFSNEKQPRWWRTKILEKIYELSALDGLPWERGRGIEGLTEGDYSSCHSSGDPFPETVAYVDQTPDAQEVQIKIKNTVIHPDFESSLFFEEIRLMQPAE